MVAMTDEPRPGTKKWVRFAGREDPLFSVDLLPGEQRRIARCLSGETRLKGRETLRAEGLDARPGFSVAQVPLPDRNGRAARTAGPQTGATSVSTLSGEVVPTQTPTTV